MYHLFSRWHIVLVATIVIVLSLAQLFRYYGPSDVDVLSLASSHLKGSSGDAPAAHKANNAIATHTVYRDPLTVTHTVSHTVTETVTTVVETPAPQHEEPEEKECPAEQAIQMDPIHDLNTTISVPKHQVFDPKGPRPDQVVVVTATDGKGHNGGIENIIELANSNREAYCKHHGYHYHFVNISKFDLGDVHPVWKKIPAIVDAFNTFPEAQWVFFLDLDAIIMSPKQDLSSLVLSHDGMRRQANLETLHGDFDLAKYGMHFPKEPDFENIDFIIAQDHNGMNGGAFFFRRSQWTQMVLDMWGDPLFLHAPFSQAEQETLQHFAKHHPSFRQHMLLAKQRTFNAFIEGGDEMMWKKGDLLVHLAGCWVPNLCVERWAQAWDEREVLKKRELAEKVA